MQFKTRVILMALAVMTLFSSCQDENSPLIVENIYDSTDFQKNSEPAHSAISSYNTLMNALEKGRSGSVLTSQMLELQKNDGSFYLPSRIIGGFQPVLNKYIQYAIDNSGKTFIPGNLQNGGVLDGYLFTENGVEISSMIGKGLYGAIFYYQSAKILRPGMTKAELDMVLAYYGSSPAFPNCNTNIRVPNPDILAAGNVCKRDKNDGNGLYTAIKNEFLTIQATIAGGTDFVIEQKEAIEDLKILWEKANAATVVSHIKEMINILSSDQIMTPETQATVLYNYSEAVGLLYGWKFLVNSDKLINDRDLKEIFTLLNMSESSSEGYKFVTSSDSELPKLDKVINKLALIYGFSPADIDSFQTNWALVQGR